VRLIFDRYLALGCVSKLKVDLDQKGIRSKQRILTSGRVLGGCPFDRGALGRPAARVWQAAIRSQRGLDGVDDEFAVLNVIAQWDGGSWC
jgi:hypothetical protein